MARPPEAPAPGGTAENLETAERQVMDTRGWGLAAVLALLAQPAAAEAPRLVPLTGLDARWATYWYGRLEQVLEKDKLAEAQELAEKLYRLRRDRQGEGQWLTWDARWQLEEIKRLRGRPAPERRQLRNAQRLNAAGVRLRRAGRFAEAERLHRRALAIQELALPARHPELAQTLNYLGLALDDQRRSAAAEREYRRALAIRREVLPANHPDLALSLSNLAINLNDQGRRREAEQLHREGLAVREKALPDDHAGRATALNNLAFNLNAQRRHAEAEKLYREALAIRDKVLPADHPDRAVSLANLAGALDYQGKRAEAEARYREALQIRRKVLPADHPALVTNLSNLGMNLMTQGKLAGAEPLFREALARDQRARPADHAQLAITLNNLANCLHRRGKAVEAEQLFRQALDYRRQALPPGHPELGLALLNLAANLTEQGRAAEAEKLSRQALAILQAAAGSADDPWLVTAVNNLASLLDAQGRFAEAEELHRRAVAAREKAGPGGRSGLAIGLANLGFNLQAQHRPADAEKAYRRALAVCRAAPSREPDDLTHCLISLAFNLASQGRHAEAERLCREALAFPDRKPAVHPYRAACLDVLAFSLAGQGKYAAAEKLFREVLAIRRQLLPAGHPHLARGHGNLAYNLKAQGKDAAAADCYRQAVTAYESARLLTAFSGADRALFTVSHSSPGQCLAAVLARRGHPRQAWQAAEADLARGLLDDLAGQALLDFPPAQRRRLGELNAELASLSRQILQAHLSGNREEAGRKQLRDWVARSRKLGDEVAALAAGQSRRQVASLDEVQRALPADAALVFWIDLDHPGPAGKNPWGCVVRGTGVPAWVPLCGRGADDTWTSADETRAGRLREVLSRPGGGTGLARRLARQRLVPLEPHLRGVRRLVVVPAGLMAGVPVEALTDAYQISYAPSATVYARLRQRHRPLGKSLLAVGDPAFRRTPPPDPPDHGLYLQLVLPQGNAGRAGLKAGDVLLRYNGARLRTTADLKVVTQGTGPVPVQAWRDGQVQERAVAPGPLGVVVAPGPAAEALRKRRRAEAVLTRRAGDYAPLPGTRVEVEGLARLFDTRRLLLGSEASEQRLDELIAAGELPRYRVLHFATHGEMHPRRPSLCALVLARDRLPDPAWQIEQGKKVYDGRLKVEALRQWPLDADLVVLSACETALGPDGRGEGLLGFSQALFRRGARSLVLSLWKVDDLATALLMHRFYQNLLGKRAGRAAPLGRAAALAEAKRWLRELTRAEAERIAGRLGGGAWRGRVEKLRLAPRKEGEAAPAPQPGDRPFAHPAYWSAFILLGDPE